MTQSTEVFTQPIPPKRLEPTETGAFLVELADIVVSNRARKEMGDLVELASQINETGLIHPPVVRKLQDGKFELLAGERRLRAMLILGWKRCPVTVKPEGIDNDLYCKLVELTENVGRKDYDPVERALNMEQIHKIRQKMQGEGGSGLSTGWSAKDTAKSLRYSETQVGKNLKLARFIGLNPDQKEAFRKLDLNTAVRRIGQDQHVKKVEARIEAGDLVVNSMILQGDARVLVKDLPSNSVDLYLTDGPFGLEEIQSSLGQTKGSSATYTALLGESDNMTLEGCLALYRELVPEVFRVLKPSSHIYMFCSGELQLRLIPLLQTTGFEINENVLIWDKGKTTTPFKGLEYPSVYEPIIFGHKPPRSKHLSMPDCSNILRFPAIHSSKKIHRFQKPVDLVAHLIKNSSVPGDTVLDTFAGSGVVPRVAKELKRNAIGFELDQANWLRAQMVLLHGVQKARELLSGEPA